METLDLNLTLAEIDIILQMIDKTQVAGTQAMRALLSLDAKIRNTVKEAQIKGIQTDNKKTATKKDPPAE